MKILRTVEEMRSWRKTLPSGDTLGFVPTMGALHVGHAQLLKESIRRHSHTVLSIYVNPTQFGPNEDLSKYPRTFESDCALAEELGVSAVFAPTNEALYPQDYSTYVNEENVSLPLCGKFRPGHFRGVATIVLKLFNIVQPTTAYFGLKDAQQFLVIERMVRDLNMDVSVVGVPTVREETGLALSSRNIYLSVEARKQVAPKIHATLQHAKNELLKGISPGHVITESIRTLKKDHFEVQYFDLRSVPDLKDLSSAPALTAIVNSSLATQGSYILAVAAFYPSQDGGKVRLIDNLIF